ncbi:TIGR02453 family protein [Jannaschia donghaensis]|uniref:TIGR02453 family protein n=1 Tax=Jannaschia donghaensis TaxID=420998 RepID=A0A0M6YLB2_9RHOB|nr:DUF2461 domain-containing protein [Jannaschia donghaensis]CTQ49846.1 hypothetical protein JDO7802_01863 [Jannaschia donghaensis]
MTGDDVPRFTDASFAFFKDLAANNRTDWFDAHRSDFDESVDAPFQAVLVALSDRLAYVPVSLRGSKETCFRMRRDVRFTQDKTPYVLNRSALLTRSGRKTEAGPVFYLQFASGGGMMFCGFHALDTASLNPMRRRIVERADSFDDALVVLGDAGFSLTREDQLSTMPSGFEAEKDHRHADILKLKTLGVRQVLPRTAWTSGDVVGRAETMAKATMPLLAFFD